MRRRPTDAEIAEELAGHMERIEAELLASGLDPAAAAREARRRLGDPARWRDATLEVWRRPTMLDRTLTVTSLTAVAALAACVAVRDPGPELAALDARLGALERDSAERAAALHARLDALVEASALTQEGDRDPDAIRPPTLLTELNRSGQWRTAAELGEHLLGAAAGDLDGDDEAQVLVGVAYARMRLGDTEGARTALARFDVVRQSRPLPGWLTKHARDVRAEVESSTVEREPQSAEDDGWSLGDPAEQGLDVLLLEELRSLAEETGGDASLVVHEGKIVSEWYGERYTEPAYAMSSTKSITSLLVGCLIDDGKLASIDVPVGTYLPDWSEGVRGEVTLRHLLSHTSGLPKYEDRSVGYQSDKNTFVRALEPTADPGTTFAYSNEGVQLLSPVLDAIAGEPIQEYARRRLFEPLGLRSTRFQLDSEGHAWTYADLNTTPRDLARLGQLMLQRGVWNGERIVSEEWIDESTRAAQPFRDDCGLLWWLHSEPRGFAAFGYLHTDIHVFPDLELVVVRMQSKLRPDGSYPDYRERALPLIARMAAK